MRVSRRTERIVTILNSALRISTPTQLSGLQLWYDFTDLSTLFQDTAATTPVTTTGQAIARINDKSTNANNATQATGAKQPTWTDTTDGALFDGVNHVLALAGTTNLHATNKTVVIKWKPVSFKASNPNIFGNSGAANYVGHNSSTGAAKHGWKNTIGGFINQTTSSAPFSAGVRNKYIATVLTSGSNVTAKTRVNGTLIQTDNYTDGQATPIGSYFIGALNATPSQPVNAYIAKVLFYNRVLSSAEMTALEAIL